MEVCISVQLSVLVPFNKFIYHLRKKEHIARITIHVNYLENGYGIEIIASGTVTGEEIIDAHKGRVWRE